MSVVDSSAGHGTFFSRALLCTGKDYAAGLLYHLEAAVDNKS